MRLLLISCLVLAACGPGNASKVSVFPDAVKSEPYPTSPDLSVTPGALCKTPDSYRYPEHIPYCNRNVSTGLKNRIIDLYERQLNYTIRALGRQNFKIDHFVPLCMGGSNDPENLWPQHSSVYEKTDPLEGKLCQLMEAGSMTQETAMGIIRAAKLDPDTAPTVYAQISTSSAF